MEFGCKSYDNFRDAHVDTRLMNGLNPIKMSLYGKIVNMKVVRLVETVDFDIKNILIRGRMQPVEAKQGQKQKLQSHFGPTELI